MADEYDGRMELRFHYTTTIAGRALGHVHTLDIALEPSGWTIPVTFSAVDIVTPDSTELTLAAMVDAYMALVLPFYTAATTWDNVELWRYPAEPSTDSEWLGVYEIAEVGTGTGTADTGASQGTFTYRTAGGGVMRQQFMEWRHQRTERDTPPLAVTEFENMRVYMATPGHIFVGRDDTRPVVTMALSHTQNSKVFKKRFRDA